MHEATREVQSWVGGEVKRDGFSSMATWKPFSDDWSGGKNGKGVLYTIRVPKGSEVATVRSKGEYDGEDEAIAQAGSRYRILSMGPKGSGQLRVEVELVQDQLEEK